MDTLQELFDACKDIKLSKEELNNDKIPESIQNVVDYFYPKFESTAAPKRSKSHRSLARRRLLYPNPESMQQSSDIIREFNVAHPGQQIYGVWPLAIAKLIIMALERYPGWSFNFLMSRFVLAVFGIGALGVGLANNNMVSLSTGITIFLNTLVILHVTSHHQETTIQSVGDRRTLENLIPNAPTGTNYISSGRDIRQNENETRLEFIMRHFHSGEMPGWRPYYTTVSGVICSRVMVTHHNVPATGVPGGFADEPKLVIPVHELEPTKCLRCRAIKADGERCNNAIRADDAETRFCNIHRGFRNSPERPHIGDDDHPLWKVDEVQAQGGALTKQNGSSREFDKNNLKF
jgi:hypothetical protein